MPRAAGGRVVEITVCLDAAVAVSDELTQNLAKIEDLLKYWNFRHCF